MTILVALIVLAVIILAVYGTIKTAGRGCGHSCDGCRWKDSCGDEKKNSRRK